MSEISDKLMAFNKQLETMLIEQSVEWSDCVDLIEKRDQYLKDHSRELASQDHQLKSILQKSIELNQVIADRMKVEQNDVEKALLKVNQGKKARASYE